MIIALLLGEVFVRWGQSSTAKVRRRGRVYWFCGLKLEKDRTAQAASNVCKVRDKNAA
jgi:hypothetical protein